MPTRVGETFAALGAPKGGEDGDESLPGSPPLLAPAAEDLAPAAAPADRAAPERSPARETLPATGSPEAGKGGGGHGPSFPPSHRPVAGDVVGRGATSASDIFTPAPIENPVVVALQREGLYGGVLSPSRHRMTCPWNGDHSEEQRGFAQYIEPTDDRPFGDFLCLHVHGERLGIDQLLDYLEVPAEEARCKPMIRVKEGEISRVGAAAEAVLSADGLHFHSGGRIVTVLRDHVTGDLGTTALTRQSLVKALARAARWQRLDGRSKKYIPTDPRPQVIDLLMGAQTHDVLRPLAGLARQPYLRDDGTLVTQPGYDAATKVYADFVPGDFPLPEPTEAAARVALSDLKHLLWEFRFAGPGDEAAALSANPVRAVAAKPVNNLRDRSLTAAEADRLRAAAAKSKNSQLVHIVDLLLYLGCRLNELLTARIDAVQVEQRLLFIPTSKNGRSRYVPLSAAALEVIGRLPQFEGCPWLIPNPETLKPFVTIKNAWMAARDSAGLPGLRLHDLRHAAASAMVSAGVDLYAVGKILGHANAASTQRYAHVANETLLAAVEKGAARLQQARTTS